MVTDQNRPKLLSKMDWNSLTDFEYCEEEPKSNYKRVANYRANTKIKLIKEVIENFPDKFDDIKPKNCLILSKEILSKMNVLFLRNLYKELNGRTTTLPKASIVEELVNHSV